MKKATKILSIILVLAIFAIMALGSGSSGSSSSSSTVSASDSLEKLPESNDSAKPEEKKTEDKETTVESKPSYTIENETIVDNDACVFRIVGAKDDSIWGFALKAYCENRLEDKNLMFSIDDVCVNGYECDPLWAQTVAAGKKSNDDITFSSTSFKEIGISSPDEIRFSLRIHDADDWMADNIVEDSFVIYPTGLSADQIVVPNRRSTPSEKTIFDTEDCTFIILDDEMDSIWGYTLNCFIENKSNKKLMFSWDDVSVNGYMVDPFWATEVAPGAKYYSGISFSDSKFEENGIEQVEEIEFKMKVYDSDDWMADNIIEQTFTYTP